MLEVLGDSARGEALAFVRLTVDGDRIVDADAPGLERPLAGLTLLEAAAVPRRDARCRRARERARAGLPRRAGPERIAVAMSGGVDSAVALLRAGANAIGVTLRLWLDPAGPDSERACCSPEAVIAARETCHARGLPHVTLDLREEFRRAVVDPFVRATRAARRRTRASAATAASASPSCSRSRAAPAPRGSATGHYARIVEHDGRRLLARAADADKDQSLHARAARPALPRPDLVPARRADEGRDACRGGRRRARSGHAGARARRRASSPATTTAPSSSATGCRARTARSSTRTGASSGRHDGFWRFTPGQRRGIGVAAAEPLYALRTDSATNTLVVGPRGSLARTPIDVRGRLHVAGRACRGEAPPPLAGRRRRASMPTARGFRLELEQPAYGVAPGQVAVLYDGDAVVGCTVIAPARRRGRLGWRR